MDEREKLAERVRNHRDASPPLPAAIGAVVTAHPEVASRGIPAAKGHEPQRCAESGCDLPAMAGRQRCMGHGLELLRRNRASAGKSLLASHPIRALVNHCGMDLYVAEQVVGSVLRDDLRKRIAQADLDKGIYIWSERTGNGKTLALGHYCLRHAKRLRERDIKTGDDSGWPRFVRMSAILRRVRETYNTSIRESEALRLYVEAPVLFVDDIGVHDKDHERLVLHDIIESRHPTKQLTYISGNIPVHKLGDHFDDRVMSRIVERCYPMEMEDPIDYRLKAVQ